VVWAVLAFRSQRHYLSTALRTQGVVQSIRAERLDRTTVYFPVIRFTTTAGAAVTAESKTSHSGVYQIGQSIRILYDPKNPNNLEIDAFWSRWIVVGIAAFFALVLLGIGAAAMVAGQASSGGNVHG
jgi:hypothetical protein